MTSEIRLSIIVAYWANRGFRPAWTQTIKGYAIDEFTEIRVRLKPMMRWRMSYFSFLQLQDGMADIAKHRPDRFKHMLALAHNILRGPSELSVVEREMLIAFVAGVNECEFCLGAHKAVAESFGLEPGIIERLLASDSYDAVEAKFRPLLRLARKLTLMPMRVVQQDIDAITAVGWGEEAAHDAIGCISLMNMANRFVLGHGVVGSPAYFRKEVEMLGPQGGYDSVCQEQNAPVQSLRQAQN